MLKPRGGTSSAKSNELGRGRTVALLAVLALAAFLRFYDLGEESLWVDELYSLSFVSAENAAQVVALTAAEDTHPPGYHLVLHYWRALAGESEVALRFPSAVAGVLSVLAVYLLGRRLYSHAEGLAAAFFMAVLRWPVHYSQDARSYSLLLLFSTLTAFFWWGCFRGLRNSGRLPLREAVGYVLSAVACCYLHYFGLFLVALQAAMLLLAPRAARRVLLLYAPVGLVYLPWLPAMLHQSGMEHWLWPPTYRDVLWFLRDLFNYSAVLTVVAFALLALGGLRALYDMRGSEPSLERLLPGGLLVAWFVVPPVLIYALSYAWRPLFFPRFLIICLPAVYLLLARSVFRLFGGRPLAGAVATAALAVVFLGGLVLNWPIGADYYAHGENHLREQYREAAAYAASQAGPRTVMAQCGWGGEYVSVPDRYDYYFERMGSAEGPGPHVCNLDELRTFMRRFDGGDYDRLIYLRMHVSGTEPVTQALHDKVGSPHREDFIGGEVWVYDVGDEEKAQGQLKQKSRSE
jgi:mannosyltransferase